MPLLLTVTGLLLLFLAYAYKRIKSWIGLSPTSREPYLQFLQISIFAFLSYFIFLAIFIAQLIYAKLNFDITSTFFLIPVLFIAAYMVLVYKKLEGIKLGHQINRIEFFVCALVAIFKVLLGIVSLLTALLCWIMGFGHMITD